MDETDPSILSYYTRRNELSTVNGRLLWGSKLIIPSIGRTTILEQLHECHPGINCMKSMARCYVWWPKIESEIEQLVQQCQICQIHHASLPNTPLHPQEYPQRPWSKVHIDHAGHTFLIVNDAYSKWIEAFVVPSTSTEATIKLLHCLSATHGIPEHLVSDNGLGFTSQQFAEFLATNGIKHSRTSP